MECPECGKEKHRVIKTWQRYKEIESSDSPPKVRVFRVIKRVRRCQSCGYPFTTTEEVDRWYPHVSLEKINGH